MGKKILVIDDDEDILEILDIIFREEGYQVVLSDTGEAANQLEEIKPDVVLLDIRILGAEKNGAEICARIKSRLDSKNLPVILLSAEYDIDKITAACGADAYISKPFDINYLLAQIKEFTV